MRQLIFILFLFAVSCNQGTVPTVDTMKPNPAGVVYTETYTKGSLVIKYHFNDPNKTIEITANKPFLKQSINISILFFDYVVGLNGAGVGFKPDTPNERHVTVVKWVENRDVLTSQIMELIKKESLNYR